MTKCTHCNKIIWPWITKLPEFCYPYVLSDSYQHTECFKELSDEYWANAYSTIDTADYHKMLYSFDEQTIESEGNSSGKALTTEELISKAFNDHFQRTADSIFNKSNQCKDQDQ